MGFTEMSIRQTKDFDLICALNNTIFPLDDLELDHKTRAWIVWENKLPVGFCTLRMIGKRIAYFDRAGLLERAKGQGIHSKMVAVRERYACTHHCKSTITYTMKYNIKSLITLIRKGWEFYEPEYKYSGDVYYFRKSV